MQDPALTPTDYTRLKSRLNRLVARTRQTRAKALNRVANDVYWHMGADLNTLPELPETLVTRLATDLGVPPLLLYRARYFHAAWPKGLPESAWSLSWTKHIELLSVPDAKRRRFYLDLCLARDLTREALRRAIQRDEYALRQTGATVRATLDPDADPLHIYKAVVERVLDGDTLAVRIDVGFRMWTSQIVRLRGLNTAELHAAPAESSRAEQAKAFVQERLRDIPFVLLKTYKTDAYGRYVAEVFYQPAGQDATQFLNRELVEAGLAEVVG